MNKYYNYILLNPTKPLNWEYQGVKFQYAPFYVGKGSGNRVLQHYKIFNNVNPHKENTIKLLQKGGYLPEYVILNKNSEEPQALEEEINIIAWIKSNLGDILTNITDGGNQPPTGYGEENHKSLKVYQYDKDSGELLNSFVCVREAARAYNAIDMATHICACCRGERRTALGYKWSYEKLDKISPDPQKYGRINFSKLIASKENETLEFKSMKEAYEYFGVKNDGKINEVIKGKRKSYRGYVWTTL